MNQLEGEAIAAANGFEFYFSTKYAGYFKNERMQELDAELGDISSEINDIEIELTELILSKVKECQEDLREMEQWIATIDW